MCLKRVRTKFTEANYLQVPNNENCPDNYRLCGYYNSFKDILCVKEKAHCPITYVGLETEIDHKSKKQYIDLEDGTYIAYTNETQTPLSLIPLDFTLSEGYPCWNYKRHSNITLIYPFTKHLGDFGCNPKNPTDLDKQYLDYRYIPISNVTRKLLYKDNDVYENYVDLPIPDDFTWDFETNFTLFQRLRIGFKSSCYSEAKVKENRDIVYGIKVKSTSLIVLDLFNLLFLFFFVSLKSISKQSTTNLRIVIIGIKVLLTLCFVICNIVLNVFINIEGNQIYNSLVDGFANCLDKETFRVTTLEQILPKYQYYIQINDAIFGLAIGYLSVFIIQSVYGIYKSYRTYKDKQVCEVSLAISLLKGDK